MPDLVPDPASRAGNLPLIGHELALDFANTASGRGTEKAVEHLRAPEHVLHWARHARALTPADGERLAALFAASPRLGQRLLRRALELREAIHAVAAAIAAGRRPEDAAVRRLARGHADCMAHARLLPHGTRFVWAWEPAEGAVEAVLGPLALSALTLLTGADLSRLKQCQGKHCGWLFFDTTKNKSRRWCEMEVCGNRAKQRRFHRRHAGRPADA